MGTLTLFITALCLSMDAFAVSVSNGMCYQNYSKKQAACTAFAFGLFQAIMPVAGYFAGTAFAVYIEAVDHWIAFLLLGFIGGSMVYGSIKELKQSCPEPSATKQFSLGALALQALATSIDALVVGLSFAVMRVNIVVAASFIGITTFICCLVGAVLGKRFGSLLGKRAEIIGGVILVGIGLKILLEHLFS